MSASEPSAEVPASIWSMQGSQGQGAASQAGLEKGQLIHSQYLLRASCARTQKKQDRQSPAPGPDTRVRERQEHKHLVEDQDECGAREGLLATRAWGVMKTSLKG